MSVMTIVAATITAAKTTTLAGKTRRTLLTLAARRAWITWPAPLTFRARWSGRPVSAWGFGLTWLTHLRWLSGG